MNICLITTLISTLISCTASVKGTSRRYDYMVGFVRWKTTIPGGKGYLSMACEATEQCSITVSITNKTKRFLLTPHKVQILHTSLEEPQGELVTVLRLRTYQTLTVIAGTVAPNSVYDLYPVYPTTHDDVYYFLNSPIKNAFLLIFASSTTNVKISCAIQEIKLVFKEKTISENNGLFWDLELCVNAEVRVQPIPSTLQPIRVYYGTTTVQQCVRSTSHGGKDFFLVAPKSFVNAHVTFIGLRRATRIMYQTDKGPWRSSSVLRISPWWQDVQKGVLQRDVVISFQTLYIGSSQNILVVVRFKTRTFNHFTSMCLTPVRLYLAYSYTLNLHYKSHVEISRQVVLIVDKALIQHIMVNGQYDFKSNANSWPLIRGQSSYAWIKFNQMYTMVLTVNDTYKKPGLMYVILIGTSENGNYLTEAGGFATPLCTGWKECVEGAQMKSASEEDSLNLPPLTTILLPMVWLLSVIFTVTVLGFLITFQSNKRQPADQPCGEEDKKSTSGEQQEDSPAEDDEDERSRESLGAV